MASALLSIQLIHPPQYRRVGEATRELGSRFCYRLMSYRSTIRRQDSPSRKGIISAALLGKKSGKTVKRETLIPDPDYRIPIVLLGFAGGLVYSDNMIPAVPVGLLGLLLLFQTTRVRFVLDDEALVNAIYLSKPEVKVGNELNESGENVFVGEKNRWQYSTFVNWGFWWPNFPILVYFKETQTKPEGQIHFFPVIFKSPK